jgi:hypothetical protein
MLAIIIVMIVMLVPGCRVASGNPVTAETFTVTMHSAGYEVFDITEETKDLRDFFAQHLQQAIIGVGEEYQFDFLEFIDVNYAMMLFESMRSNMENEQGNIITFHNELSEENYAMYSFVSDGTYSHLIRVYNVIIFVEADSKHRNSIREVISRF